MKSTIVFCLLLATLCTLARGKECGENEVLNTCASSCGTKEPSCIPRQISPSGPCTADCKVVCECAPDYLRHHSGTCVKKENC